MDKNLIKLIIEMLDLAQNEFSNHGCNDLEKRVIAMIPEEWCEEARMLNSNGADPWPEKTSDFDDSGLMWFLMKKLKQML